jgi:hypothetical protein
MQMFKRLISKVRAHRAASKTSAWHASAPARQPIAQERCERRKRDASVTRTCSCCLLNFGDHRKCCGHRSAQMLLDGR